MTAAPLRKNLIEVSIPLEAINRESEKSIRHEHPSTLHLWWARRPLAACRAVLFAQLVDDPSSCPEEFPTKAAQDAERDRLHRLIERLVPWKPKQRDDPQRGPLRDRALGGAGPRREGPRPRRDEAAAGHRLPSGVRAAGLRPVLGRRLDPAGGAAARPQGDGLGLEPGRGPDWQGADRVPAQVCRPHARERRGIDELHQWKGAQGLADDVRYYGRWMRSEAEKKIGHLYPKVKLKDGKKTNIPAS
jgi:putative DNA methylase